MNEKELLSWLRKEIIETKESRSYLLKHLATSDDINDFETCRIWLGEIFALEKVIKHIRKLSEREFQMEKKKGTL